MPPVLSGGIGNHCELLVSQQILIPACLDEVAAELVVEYLLGLIGLERCYDLLVGLQLVRILEVSGTRCDQVPVLLDVQLVILVDGVLGLKAEIQCVVAVYDSCGNVSQCGRDYVSLQLLDGDLGVVGLDVVDGRVELGTVLQLDQARKKIGMIFQHFNLMPSRTVAGNVAYPLRGSGLSKQQIEEKVQRLLDLVGIGDKAEAYPKQLSGGQKQRVAIARALANDPNVLLCDEATSALDPQTTKAILQLLKHLNETLGITVVIITHEMAVVKEICHRVAVMEHGKVVESGEVFNIFANPREDITKNFIHTTSNLRKIEELIAEDSPVVKLNPGELIVRLSYIQRNVSEPLISTVSRKFDIVLNIIFSDIAIVQDAPIGGTVAIISGSRDQITQAIAYLSEKNVGVEVIKDARVSE